MVDLSRITSSKQKIAHRLMAKTARDICSAVWEVCSSNDKFHARWPIRAPFVQTFYTQFLGHARNSLIQMLKPIEGTDDPHLYPEGPEYQYSEHIRNEIFEALLLEGEMKSLPQ